MLIFHGQLLLTNYLKGIGDNYCWPTQTRRRKTARPIWLFADDHFTQEKNYKTKKREKNKRQAAKKSGKATFCCYFFWLTFFYLFIFKERHLPRTHNPATSTYVCVYAGHLYGVHMYIHTNPYIYLYIKRARESAKHARELVTRH